MLRKAEYCVISVALTQIILMIPSVMLESLRSTTFPFPKEIDERAVFFPLMFIHKDVGVLAIQAISKHKY